MSYLTRETFLKKVEASGSKYWQEGKNYRWQYMSYVIDRLKEICPDDSKLIEAGTSGMPLSDRSYLYEYPECDLNQIPFRLKTLREPIIDKNFDCFVALQVWEHLDNQSAAFQEVMRISKSAILSFPYMWPKSKGHDARHVGIDDIKIKQWTCGVKPEKTKLINNRMVCVWIFK
jgi:hypothetical protein